MFSYLLEASSAQTTAAYDIRAREIHNAVATAFATPDALTRNIPEFLRSASQTTSPPTASASTMSAKVNLAGVTPTREEFIQLVRFLNTTASRQVFFDASSRGNCFPEASDYPIEAAGVLSIPISRIPRDYLVFFRKEVEKTVTWAGEPEKIQDVGPHGVRLTPRKSFEAWREVVRFQSERWSTGEIRAAEKLRVTLIEIILRMSEWLRRIVMRPSKARNFSSPNSITGFATSSAWCAALFPRVLPPRSISAHWWKVSTIVFGPSQGRRIS